MKEFPHRRRNYHFLNFVFHFRGALYPTVLNNVDVVWKARLTLVTENEINDRPKPVKLLFE